MSMADSGPRASCSRLLQIRTLEHQSESNTREVGSAYKLNPMKFTLLLLSFAVAGLRGQDTPRPRILGVPHVAFRVHDIAASRHFYKDFLGYAEPFSIVTDGKLIMAFIKVNDRQYIELSPEANPDEPRFLHLALETDNAEALRLYVKSKGYKVPEKPASKGRIHN